MTAAGRGAWQPGTSRSSCQAAGLWSTAPAVGTRLYAIPAAGGTRRHLLTLACPAGAAVAGGRRRCRSSRPCLREPANGGWVGVRARAFPAARVSAAMADSALETTFVAAARFAPTPHGRRDVGLSSRRWLGLYGTSPSGAVRLVAAGDGHHPLEAWLVPRGRGRLVRRCRSSGSSARARTSSSRPTTRRSSSRRAAARRPASRSRAARQRLPITTDGPFGAL